MKMRKKPQESRTEYNTIVRPADANSLGACFGGTILQWMDMVASICARRHSNTRVNTAKAVEVNFIKPLHVGDVANLVAQVVRTFRSSMEVHVWLYVENTYQGTTALAADAIFLLVGLNENKKPVTVHELVPQTEKEISLWEAAGERRKQQTKKRDSGQ